LVMSKVMQIPTEFKRLFDTDWREAAIYGGRGSLKSHTVARYLLIRARQSKTRILCGREIQRSIKDSSHQLLKDLIKEYELTDFRVTNDSILNTINGSEFLFKGLYGNEQTIKSTEGVDIAWIEEAQTVTESSIEILTPTIRKDGSQIIYTYNRLDEEDPIHKRLVLEGRPNTLIINVNYDTAMKYGWFPEVLRIEMEDDRARRPDLYKHKWLGEPAAMLESRVYKDWAIIEDIPHEAHLERYGLDFGWNPDMSSLVAIYSYNGGYILDEVNTQMEWETKDIASTLKNLPKALTIGDLSDKRSINDIKMYGVNIRPCEKSPDSLRHGVKTVQELKISVTRQSTGIISGYKTWLRAVDKDGKIIAGKFEHEPDPLAAARYALETLVPVIRKKEMIRGMVMNQSRPKSNIAI